MSFSNIEIAFFKAFISNDSKQNVAFWLQECHFERLEFYLPGVKSLGFLALYLKNRIYKLQDNVKQYMKGFPREKRSVSKNIKRIVSEDKPDLMVD